MRRWIVVLAFIALITGGVWYFISGDGLKEAVNAQWPPVTVDQQRQAAIDGGFAALSAMTQPNVAAGADIKTIELIANEQVKGKGVTTLSLKGDSQLLKAIASFDVTLKPADFENDPQAKEWVEKLRPQIVGRLELFLGASTKVVDSPARALETSLLPALKSFHVEKIELADSYDFDVAKNLLIRFLNTYADNIAGTFTNNPVLKTQLPASIKDQIDPSKLLKIAPPAGTDFKIGLSSKPFTIPFALQGTAILVDKASIAVLAQIGPGDPAKLGHVEGKTFNDLSAAFNKHMSEKLDLNGHPEGAWAAISKEFVAEAVNSAFMQSQTCLNGSGAIPRQTFGAKIPTPDPASIDCTPKLACNSSRNCDLKVDTRDCRRPRDCRRNHDTRDCNECLARAPRICLPFDGGCSGGQCIQRWNNAACEAAKAAQNAGYETAYQACRNLGPLYDVKCEADKAAQNVLYATEKGQCEAAKKAEDLICEGKKTGLKIACEGVKGAVSGVHQTGNIGNFDGSIGGTGNLQVCFKQVTFAKDLKSLEAKLEASGSAALDTSFKFTPLDVAGHILCQVPWTASRRIDVKIPGQTIGTNVSLSRSPKSLEYQGQLKATPIRLRFEPSPLSLVLRNINFQLACPVTAGLINATTLNLAPLVPDLLKDYTHTLEPMNFSFSPDIPEQALLGHAIKPVLSDTGKALVVSGTISP